jgi:hypothetical protein
MSNEASLLLLVLICAVASVATTAALAWSVGLRIARHNRAVAFTICGAAVPAGVAIWALAELTPGWVAPSGALDERWIFVGLVLLVEAVALPSSFATSGLMILRFGAIHQWGAPTQSGRSGFTEQDELFDDASRH